MTFCDDMKEFRELDKAQKEFKEFKRIQKELECFRDMQKCSGDAP